MDSFRTNDAKKAGTKRVHFASEDDEVVFNIPLLGDPRHPDDHVGAPYTQQVFALDESLDEVVDGKARFQFCASFFCSPIYSRDFFTRAHSRPDVVEEVLAGDSEDEIVDDEESSVGKSNGVQKAVFQSPRAPRRYRTVPLAEFNARYGGRLTGRTVITHGGDIISLVAAHGAHPDWYTGTRAFAYRTPFNVADVRAVRVYAGDEENVAPPAPRKKPLYSHEQWTRRALFN